MSRPSRWTCAYRPAIDTTLRQPGRGEPGIDAELGRHGERGGGVVAVHPTRQLKLDHVRTAGRVDDGVALDAPLRRRRRSAHPVHHQSAPSAVVAVGSTGTDEGTPTGGGAVSVVAVALVGVAVSVPRVGIWLAGGTSAGRGWCRPPSAGSRSVPVRALPGSTRRCRAAGRPGGPPPVRAPSASAWSARPPSRRDRPRWRGSDGRGVHRWGAGHPQRWSVSWPARSPLPCRGIAVEPPALPW